MWLAVGVGILIGISLGFHAGWYGKKAYELLQKIWERDPEPEAKTVTPLPPEVAGLSNIGSAFISPKPPEVVRYEEEQRINRLNRL